MEEKDGAKKPKNRTPIREQLPLERARNFMEVPYGYTPEEAMKEASRCLNCLRPTCRSGCPVSVDIPSFIRLIREGRFIEAAWKIKEDNALPAVCGRVCPQEIQCESMCILGKKGDPVAIGNLERFVSDYEREKGEVQVLDLPKPTGRKIAIIGSGPAGLSCAADLAKSGHQVTLFEAEQNDLKGAERYLKAALKADPSMASAAYNLAVIVGGDRPDEAIALCRQAVKSRPADPKYGFTLAYYLLQKVDEPSAVSTLESVLEHSPNHLDSVQMLGQLHEQAGRNSAAAALYERTIARASLTAEMQAALRARIESLRTSTKRQ